MKSNYDPQSAGIVPACLSLIKTISRGSTYVAVRKIRAGELIMIEEPIASIPLVDVKKSGGRPGHRLKLIPAYRNTVDRTEKTNLSSLALLAISVIRCMKNSSASCRNVEALCSNIHNRNPQEMEIFGQEAKMISKFVAGFTEFEIIVLQDKLCRNVFTITGPEMDPLGIGLYINCSKFNHSCVPNAHQSFCSNKIYVHATRMISKGEEVTISYIDVGQPTAARRHELMKSYHFICHCEKCVYVELNNALKCPQGNCGGSIRPLSNLYEKAMYINWLEGKAPPPITENSYNNYFRQIPYGEVIDASINKGNESYWSRRLDQVNMEFLCNKCRSVVSLTSISSNVSSFIGSCNHKSTVENRVNNFKYATEAARLLFFDNHYIVMDTTSKLIIELLASSMFEDALSVNLVSLRSFQCIYSPNSAVVAIQELQIGKLFAYVGDRSMAVFYISTALTKLVTTLGSDSALAQSARTLLLNFTRL